jgi:hypothetical protein
MARRVRNFRSDRLNFALLVPSSISARGRALADIFISYSKRDRPLAVAVSGLLRGRGYSVWWDEDMTPRESWDRIIEREIATARSVLVLWTNNAVASDWVRIEANYARNCKPSKLIQARFDNCDVPLAFSMIQYVDLPWERPDRSPSWPRLMEWLSAIDSSGIDPGEAALAHGSTKTSRAPWPVAFSARTEWHAIWPFLCGALIIIALMTLMVSKDSLHAFDGSLTSDDLFGAEMFEILLASLLGLPYFLRRWIEERRFDPRLGALFILVMPVAHFVAFSVTDKISTNIALGRDANASRDDADIAQALSIGGLSGSTIVLICFVLLHLIPRFKGRVRFASYQAYWHLIGIGIVALTILPNLLFAIVPRNLGFVPFALAFYLPWQLVLGWLLDRMTRIARQELPAVSK